MTNPLDLFAAGITDPTVAEAFRQVEAAGSLFKDPDALPVDDANGNPLKVNGVYLTERGIKIRITKCVFGSGNFMDTYYHVYGIDENLKDTRFTVDVKHRHKMPSHYPSKLKPVEG